MNDRINAIRAKAQEIAGLLLEKGKDFVMPLYDKLVTTVWPIIEERKRTFAGIGIATVVFIIFYTLYTLIDNARGSVEDFLISIFLVAVGLVLFGGAAFFVALGLGFPIFTQLQSLRKRYLAGI